MKRALFIADHERGQGHVIRSRALANELANRGWACGACSKRPPGFEGDVVVVDGNEFDPEVYRWGVPVVAIRDVVQKPRGVKLTVVPTAGASSGQAGGPLGMLVGPRFSLIRPEFADVKWYPMMDIFDARAVKDMSVWEIGLRMAHSAVVITYGGMRAMEAARIGAPMVILARNAGELMNAEGLAHHGAAKHVAEEDQVAPMVERLLKSPRERLERMSRAGRELVDGLGCQRVADAIEEEVGA